MSKGNPRVTLRLDRPLLEQVEEAVGKANKTRKAEPYDVSSWIRACILEKLAHLRRSNLKSKNIPREGDGEQA